MSKNGIKISLDCPFKCFAWSWARLKVWIRILHEYFFWQVHIQHFRFLLVKIVCLVVLCSEVKEWHQSVWELRHFFAILYGATTLRRHHYMAPPLYGATTLWSHHSMAPPLSTQSLACSPQEMRPVRSQPFPGLISWAYLFENRHPIYCKTASPVGCHILLISDASCFW